MLSIQHTKESSHEWELEKLNIFTNIKAGPVGHLANLAFVPVG